MEDDLDSRVNKFGKWLNQIIETEESLIRYFDEVGKKGTLCNIKLSAYRLVQTEFKEKVYATQKHDSG